MNLWPPEHDLDDDRPGDEADAPWMILLPVTVQVTLPYEVRYPTPPAPAISATPAEPMVHTGSAVAIR